MGEKKEESNFSKTNYLLITISVILIVSGFVLVSGGGTVHEFNPEIFSVRRVTVGPMISLFGFVFMIFAILYKPKNKA